MAFGIAVASDASGGVCGIVFGRKNREGELMSFVVGVDIGGTKSLLGLVDARHAVYEFFSFDTPDSSSKLFSMLLHHTRFWSDRLDVSAIGIGTAGCVDSRKKTVSDSFNLYGPGLFSIGKKFSSLKLPVAVENDANAWAFGEFVTAKKKPSFLGVLTLGTGIGCGLVFEGKLFHGKNFASEFGQCVVTDSGFVDSGGVKGSLEAQANALSVVRRAKLAGLPVSNPLLVSELARGGNTKARKVLEETGYWVGIGVANLVSTLHLDRVVLAGGLSNSPFLVNAAKKTAKKLLYPSLSRGLMIEKTDLSSFGGAIGAAALARKLVRKKGGPKGPS